VDEAANVRLWYNRVLMERVFQESAGIKARSTGLPADILLANQWDEQGRVNDLFYSKALRDLDKDRGADTRTIGGQAAAPNVLGPAMHGHWTVGYKGQAASASGRVQSGRHSDARASMATAMNTPSAPQATAAAASDAGAVTPSQGQARCGACNEPMANWFRLCPMCAHPAQRAGQAIIPDPPMSYKAPPSHQGAESVASRASQYSSLSVAERLRAARRVEKNQAAAVKACVAKLTNIWMEQDLASAGARLEAFTNGSAAERAQGVAAQNAKERRGLAAAIRPDKDPPEHWIRWESGLIRPAVVEVGVIRAATDQAAHGPQAVGGLTDQMMAVIDRATAPVPTGFHGPSQLITLSPRSEATTQVHDNHSRKLATVQVRATLAELHRGTVTAVAIDSVSTDHESEMARKMAFETILDDPTFNSWSSEAVAAARVAISRKHSWATTEPITATGRKWHCAECRAECVVTVGHEGPVYGCGPREAALPPTTPMGSAWVVVVDPPATVAPQATAGLTEAGNQSVAGPEAASKDVEGPAVFDGDDPGHMAPSEAQPASQALPLPPSPSLRERLLASPLLDLGAYSPPQSAASLPPQLFMEDGAPPVATTSSLGGEWGVIQP